MGESRTENKTESRSRRWERLFHSHWKVEHLEMENQSAQHAGHYSGDGDSHWRVLLVAQEFQGLNRVQRHQRVYALLQEDFNSGLHALSLELLSPEEWQKKSALEAKIPRA